VYFVHWGRQSVVFPVWARSKMEGEEQDGAENNDVKGLHMCTT